METRVNEMIQKHLTGLPGKIGFYYKNMVTGEEVGYHEQDKMMAASVIKLYMMAAAFSMIEEGSLSPDETVTMKKEYHVPSCGALAYLHEGLVVTVMDLITLMIIFSDNTATNILMDLLGMEYISDRIRKLGFEDARLNRKMYDLEKSRRGIQNIITPAETGRLLCRMQKGSLVSEKASRQMLTILKNQQVNSEGTEKVPSSTKGEKSV